MTKFDSPSSKPTDLEKAAAVEELSTILAKLKIFDESGKPDVWGVVKVFSAVNSLPKKLTAEEERIYSGKVTPFMSDSFFANHKKTFDYFDLEKRIKQNYTEAKVELADIDKLVRKINS